MASTPTCSRRWCSWRAPVARTWWRASDLESAAGLTQILAGTGAGLLGMKVDVAQSTRLTRGIRRARRKGDARRVRRLEARRRRVDERFDPRKALAGTGRYLGIARGPPGPGGPGAGGLPHGDREPAARAGPARRRAHPIRAAVLRLDSHQPPPDLRLLLHAERRLGQLPVAGAGGEGDHAPAPRRSGRARPPGRAVHGQGLGRGGAAPGRRHASSSPHPATSRTPWTAATCGRSPATSAAPACGATRAWASWLRGWRPSPRPTRPSGPAPTRWRSTWLG